MAGLDFDGAGVIVWIAALLAAGVVGGMLAGLLGVGGGIIIVPVLYNLLAAFGVDPDMRMHVAVGTSLTTIILTSVVSVRSHHRRGAVDFQLLKSWAPSIIVGVVLGTAMASAAKGEVLTAIFATVALIVAANMLLRRNSSGTATGFPNVAVKSGLGLLVGSISAMMGIGGGTLSVPILSAFGFDMRRAVGTAAAIGFVIAIPGTIGFVLAGLGVDDRPPFSFGYVNLAAAAILVPITTATAPFGARLAHTIDKRTLQYCFAFFLALTSVRMFVDLLA